MGTMISACRYTHANESDNFMVGNIWVGIIQMSLAVVVWGWVWSLIWGYMLYRQSRSVEVDEFNGVREMMK